jgi:hypothetical protein
VFAPVSGTSYKILDNGILYRINPDPGMANGAYVQYSGQLYYIYRDGFLLKSDVAFTILFQSLEQARLHM